MARQFLSLLLLLMSSIYVHAADAPEGVRTDAQSQRRLPPITSQCIFIRSVNDWRGLDRYNLIVWAPSKKHPYHLELDSACHDIRHANAISFTAGADNRLCGYGGDSVTVSRGGWTDRCRIGAIHKLTPESAEELIAAFKQMRKNRAAAARQLREAKRAEKAAARATD